MSTAIQPHSKPIISETSYYGTTGTFFGIAVIAAGARVFIRVYHLNVVNADDYLFFIAVATFIAGAGLFFAFIGTFYDVQAINEGNRLPPPDFLERIEDAAIPGYLHSAQNFLYYSVASDIVIELMVISIPVIVLRRSSINFQRKLIIAGVLCLRVLMIAIGLVRGISAGVVGSVDQTWNAFWVQFEASISVIIACATAFRSLFLVNHASKNSTVHDNRNEGQQSMLQGLCRRTKPSLPSAKVGATMTGIRTAIYDNGNTQLDSQDGDDRHAPSFNWMHQLCLDPSP